MPVVGLGTAAAGRTAEHAPCGRFDLDVAGLPETHGAHGRIEARHDRAVADAEGQGLGVIRVAEQLGGVELLARLLNETHIVHTHLLAVGGSLLGVTCLDNLAVSTNAHKRTTTYHSNAGIVGLSRASSDGFSAVTTQGCKVAAQQ
jgi:hypothetical protein